MKLFGGRRLAMPSLGVACICAYLAWLGWHAPYVVDPETSRSEGPYTGTQVVGLVLTVLVLVGLALWWTSRPRAVVNTVTAALVLVYSADAATQPSEDASLWPVGVLVCAPVLWSLAFAVVRAAESSQRRRNPAAQDVDDSEPDASVPDVDADIVAWRRYRDRGR